MLRTRTFGEREPLVAKPTELRVTDLAVFLANRTRSGFRDYWGLFGAVFGLP
jgi:hypothetical protein